MRAREFITELFNTPIKITKVSTRSLDLAGRATVAYSFDVGDPIRKYIVYFWDNSSDGKKEWNCAFGNVLMGDDGKYQFNFTPTGDGDQYEIYSGVKAIINTVLVKFKPDSLMFSGYTNKQTELYRRLVSNKNNLPRGYLLVPYEHTSEITLVRNYNIDETLITELFDSNMELHRVIPSRLQQNRWVAAWRFTVPVDGEDTDYLVYFFSHDGGYICAFAEVLWYDDETGTPKLTFDPNDNGNQFKVYSAVKKAFMEFVNEFKPQFVAFSGWDEKQTKLYNNILRNPRNVPPGYKVGSNNDGIMIYRDDGLHESGGLVVPGINTTCDVSVGEIARQAVKFGNKVDANGVPPVWTGLSSFTSAKDTPNKGDPYYGKDGTAPHKKAPNVKK